MILKSDLFDFRKPQNKEELLKFLNISENWLEKAINKAEIPERNACANEIPPLNLPYFIKHQIPKRSKHRTDQHRTVWEAGYYLADAYKAFTRRFELFLRKVETRYPHPCAFGYIRGRSTIENAKPHCGKKLILHADIENFFPSISAKRIYERFLELDIHEEVASILARFVTIENALPLGLHSSPMLANLICTNLDEKLSKLARQYSCEYTRYADDISISGNEHIPTREEIKNLLEEDGFALAERKFRITKPGQAHYVTGLSVSTKNSPYAPRSMKRRLRQELYYCKKYGISDHLHRISDGPNLVNRGVNRIDGTINYIDNIEQYPFRLRNEWRELLEREKLGPSYHPLEDNQIRHITFYIDESEIEFNGKAALAVSLSSMRIEDQPKIETTTIKILRKHLIDPFSGGHKDELERQKLHYGDANENLRGRYIEEMSTFPFKGYIAFNVLPSEKLYEERYLFLIKSLLPHRFMGCDRAYVKMIFEQNSKVKPEKIKQMISDVYRKLEKTNNRRPLVFPDIIIGKKAEHPCFSVPDFLLGVWGRYIKEQNSRGDLVKLQFECLRDKYRIIFDADKNTYYSRKRPFLSTYWNWANSI